MLRGSPSSERESHNIIGQTGSVTMTTFDAVDGYAYLDLVNATRAVGPARSARKVLDRTSIDLARHATYALAIHGLTASGAVIALNHERDSAEPLPEAAFANASAPWRNEVGFLAHTGLGLSDEEVGDALAPSAQIVPIEELIDASAVGCTSLDGAAVLIASTGDEPNLLGSVQGSGATSVQVITEIADALTMTSDVLFVRGTTGVLDHEVLADTRARLIVGLQPLTTTARGLAVASGAGSVIVPDFVSAGGPYVAALSEIADKDELLDHVRSEAATAAARYEGSGVNTFVRACEIAEEFLRTWVDQLPFGRPLAP